LTFIADCNIITFTGLYLVSTGILSIKLQVGGTRYEQKAINANKVKNAFASLFRSNSLALA